MRGRVSPSTQKQALNALVCFLQEGLNLTSGRFFPGSRRAEKPRRILTVLTRDECRRLFTALNGTTRLMAQLAYGSGVRVMELLRLRIQDVDLERLTVTVRAGKGDKDRMAPLPERLVDPVRAHLTRLREPHTEDRDAGVPGVWLPEGLDKKIPKPRRPMALAMVFPIA